MRDIVLILLLVSGTGAFAQTNRPPGANVRVAKPFPTFALTDVDGQTLTSSNFTGKAMIVWFFASWDKPCQRQLPVLLDLQRDYRTAGLVVLGVSLDTKGPETVKTFAAAHNVSFPIAMADMKFIQDCGGLEAVPTLLVVEPHANIIGRYVGVTERAVLEPDLKAIFNQPKD